jgi:hypothetical protein
MRDDECFFYEESSPWRMSSELFNPPRGAREGWLPAYRVGQVWQFDRCQVLAWLKAHPAVGYNAPEAV